jgi:hypothetical protein
VADARLDADVLVVLFADDAVVNDEGKLRHRARVISAWRDGPASTIGSATRSCPAECAIPYRV